jgi:hypothetical protein
VGQWRSHRCGQGQRDQTHLINGRTAAARHNLTRRHPPAQDTAAFLWF